MPKFLTRQQPTSSVAAMLEPGVTAHVMARPEPNKAAIPNLSLQSTTESVNPRVAQIQSSGETPSVSRQFTLTPSADRVLKRLIAIYGEATDLDLKYSELLRAILFAAEHALPELVREAAHIGKLKRPKNDRGNAALRDELERRIARGFLAGMRGSGLMDPRRNS